MKSNLPKEFLLLLLFLPSFFAAQVNTYSTPGDYTYIVPANITQIRVECWGAGGRGGTRTNDSRAGGGGGGAYASSVISVTSGQNISVRVGAGSNSSSPGGDTWVFNASTVMAKGGNSVGDSPTGATGGSATSSFGTIRYSGGNGADQSNSGGGRSGGGGSSAGSATNGVNATNENGAIAPTGGGNGGNGRTSAGVGTSGTQPGGGGGGGYNTNNSGGAGGNGRVVITAITPTTLQVTGNSSIILSGGGNTPSLNNNTDFGEVFINENYTKTFTIINTSTVNNLTIGTFSFTGTHAALFSLVQAPASNIAPGQSTSFTIGFNSNSTGVKTASVSFSNNSDDFSNFSFNLQGNGLVYPAFSHTIYYENFDQGTGGWLSSTVDGRVGTWIRTSAPLIGQGFYFRSDARPFLRNTGIYLTSPMISTLGYKDLYFSMDVRFELPDSGDGIQVQYSIDNGAWTVLNGGSGLYWYTNSSITGLNNTAGWTGTNAESDNSPSKFLEVTLPSEVLNNRSNVRFRIFFSDDNDTNLGNGVAIDNVVLRGNPIEPFSNPINGPANVNNHLKLWLKSDAIMDMQDGELIQTWNDLAFDNHASSYGSFAPVYRNHPSRNINFNPVVDFNRSSQNHLKGKGGFWTNEYFIVVQTNSIFNKTTSNSMVPFSGKFTKNNMGQDGTGLGLGRISSRFNENAMVSHMLSTYNISGAPGADSYGRSFAPTNLSSMGQDVMIINVKSNTLINPPVAEIYVNGKRVDNHTATTGTSGTGTPLNHTDFRNLIYNIGAGQFTLNGFSLNSYLDGKVTEIFSYSEPNSFENQQKIHSYLAIKNGVSLQKPDSPLSVINRKSDWNFVNSDGVVIWNATTNQNYAFDVAAIGLDQKSQLNQKQSKNTHSDALVSIGIGKIFETNSLNNNAFIQDQNFLFWGSNGAPMSNSGVPLQINLGPETVTTQTEIVQRKWKAIEVNGDVGTVEISIPLFSITSGLPVLAINDAYVMVVANNEDLTEGVETVFLKIEGDNLIGWYDFDATKYFTFGIAHRATQPNHLTFDGINDYVKIDKVNTLNHDFTIMVWVQLSNNNQNNSLRTIFAKANQNEGYQMYVTLDNRIRMEWKVGETTFGVTSSVALPIFKWHHVSVTFNQQKLTLWIDGVEDTFADITIVPSNLDAFFTIGAKFINKNDIQDLYKGSLDELRIFNRSLTKEEIRFIINQEIEQNQNGIKGKVLPPNITKNDISNLLWNNLIAYYSMNSFIGTHLDDDSLYTNRGCLVVPDKISILPQTAPLPYESEMDGTWENPSVWKNAIFNSTPNSLSIINQTTPIDWNIVRVTNTVNSNGNKTLLGLFVSGQINASNNTKLEISHYLKLDGKIDLIERSQLVQTFQSDLDPLSIGFVERDQQGHKNRFNYNYWSFPVSSIHATNLNHGGSVNNIMRDGTNPNNPLQFQWTSSLNGSSTTPITLSTYWIFKFQNTTPLYANWTQSGPNGIIVSGQGFTMKGHGNVGSGLQNYVFRGKPNNGNITTYVGPNNLNLSGNPYPSALDAEKFIDDNLGVITGAIYLWEHFETNNTHNLAGYQGGYATLTKVGATPPIAPAGISGMGTSEKIARRYIPVGQGFFIFGNANGGTVEFNNSQRAFFKEDGMFSNTLFKPGKGKDVINPEDHFTNNSEDIPNSVIDFPKIRVGFNTNTGHHRQVLIGFMGAQADDGFNPGFDGRHIDNQPSDMYFIMNNSTTLLNIQGVGNFDITKSYPIGVKAGANGNFQFTLDSVENIPDEVPIFIFDQQTGIYHNIRNGFATIALTSGNHHQRFQLRFQDQTLSNNPNELLDNIQLFYTSKDKSIHIKNNQYQELKEMKVFNMLGQEVLTKFTFDQVSHEIIAVNQLNTGSYLVKLVTEFGSLTTKFIVP